MNPVFSVRWQLTSTTKNFAVYEPVAGEPATAKLYLALGSFPQRKAPAEIETPVIVKE